MATRAGKTTTKEYTEDGIICPRNRLPNGFKFASGKTHEEQLGHHGYVEDDPKTWYILRRPIGKWSAEFGRDIRPYMCYAPREINYRWSSSGWRQWDIGTRRAKLRWHQYPFNFDKEGNPKSSPCMSEEEYEEWKSAHLAAKQLKNLENEEASVIQEASVMRPKLRMVPVPVSTKKVTEATQATNQIIATTVSHGSGDNVVAITPNANKLSAKGPAPVDVAPSSSNPTNDTPATDVGGKTQPSKPRNPTIDTPAIKIEGESRPIPSPTSPSKKRSADMVPLNPNNTDDDEDRYARLHRENAKRGLMAAKQKLEKVEIDLAAIRDEQTQLEGEKTLLEEKVKKWEALSKM